MPAHLAEHLLEVAKYLDNSFTFGQNSALNNLNSFVQKPQSILFSYERPEKIIQQIITLTDDEWKKAEDLANKSFAKLEHLDQKQIQQVLLRLCDEVFGVSK